MEDHALDPIELVFKGGDEPFTKAGASVGFDLLEFWRWSTSDLVDNTTRGVLAEYIVAKALRLETLRPRQSWAPWDLTWNVRDGVTIKIEVKSAAYLQSWGQRNYSKIKFLVPKRRGSDGSSSQLEATPRRPADVYVFALLHHKDKASVDPTKLEQWSFWVLPTHKLDERTRSQHSITLRSLQGLAGESLGFDQLVDAVMAAGRRSMLSANEVVQATSAIP